jgi:acyl-CoA synthetase (NDP forming)
LEEVIRACASRRVRGAVILSAPPFPMTGLVAEARRFGLRLVGPASMGIISTSRQAPLQASLSPAAPRPGHVALSLQSGPLGAALLQQAANLQLGLSWFVSLGERSDVSGNDLLQFWEDDAETTVIAIYTERFGNPRKFARIARRVALTRPIVAVESGGDRITDALYLQAGVIRVPSVSDLLDTARVLASQPLPAGPRTAIIANATSPDRLTRNALRSAGLELATTGGRVLAWDTAEDDVADAIAAALAEPSVDAVLVIHASPVYQAAASLAPAIERAAAGSTKPIVAVILGRPEGPIVDGGNVPGFAFPEPAALAIGRLWRYAKWRREEAETPAPASIRDTQAIADLDQLLASSDGLLSVEAAKPVFAAAGIAIPATRTAPSAADAVAFAEEIGFPVVLKRLGTRPLGRSVEAGIALDLRTAAAVRDAYAAVDAVGGVGPIVVQRMQTPGVEVRIAVSQHPALGPVLTVGPGGQSGTALGDHAQRLLPLSRRGITELLSSSRLGGLLVEHGVDFGPLTDLVERVSDLATQHDRIASVVLDPVLVSAAACAVSDAWIELHRSDTPTAALRQLD